jgi:D-alanine-D-alanine ligase
MAFMEAPPLSAGQKRVAVVYNHVGEDEYEHIRSIDPASLDFIPAYPIHVATVQEEYHAIVRALRAEGFLAREVNLEDNLRRLLNLGSRTRPDVVFNLTEQFRDDPTLESAVAGLLELFGVPYTGASAFCLALCARKGMTKRVLLQNGIPTPHFRLLRQPGIERGHGLRYPLIVKPARQDASRGVEIGSVVRDHTQLLRQLDRVFDAFRAPILVEEFIEGKEFHVSVFGNNPPEALPIVEFDFSDLARDHPSVITYDVKWNPLSVAYHKVHSLCPARIGRRVESSVKAQALAAFAATSCRDYARIDMRLSEDGTPYVLEVNPNPDLTEGVSFMESAEAAGLGFSETLRRIVQFALARGQ